MSIFAHSKLLLIALASLLVVIVIQLSVAPGPRYQKQWCLYQGLVSDGRNHFTHAQCHSQLYRFGETNPYVEAFFAWWETTYTKRYKN
jgi:hypothetical protein